MIQKNNLILLCSIDKKQQNAIVSRYVSLANIRSIIPCLPLPLRRVHLFSTISFITSIILTLKLTKKKIQEETEHHTLFFKD
jgi:hypothetical protein